MVENHNSETIIYEFFWWSFFSYSFKLYIVASKKYFRRPCPVNQNLCCMACNHIYITHILYYQCIRILCICLTMSTFHSTGCSIPLRHTTRQNALFSFQFQEKLICKITCILCMPLDHGHLANRILLTIKSRLVLCG